MKIYETVKMRDKIKIKVGVLIIGSLLWDEGNRENWRKNRLSMNRKIQVRAPIRYGRRSGVNKNLTMIFSSECKDPIKNGTAYLVPFKNREVKSFRGILNQARFLSSAEGANDNFLKKGQEEWCTFGLLFNPLFSTKLKRSILSKWEGALLKDFGLGNVDLYDSVLSESGELNIDWLGAVDEDNQNVIDTFDVVIATCTRPTESPFPSAKTIAEDVKVDHRKYFYKNIEHGITTFQDRRVFECL